MKRQTIRFFIVLLGIALTFSYVGCSSQDQGARSSPADQQISEEGKPFQDLEFPLPTTAKEKTYLGLSGEGTFKISQIKANVLLIEVFSNLCPHCHSEAPQVNKLYEAIEARPDLKGKIKLIGIGAANDDEANKKFKKMHDVQFPIFPDQDFSTTMDILKISTTPTFIGVTISPEGAHKSFYFESGPFGEAPEFLTKVLKLSGLEKEG